MKKKLIHVVMLVGLLFGSLGNTGVALADSVDALVNETTTTETSTVANESAVEEMPIETPASVPEAAPEASTETQAEPVEEAAPEVAVEEPAEETPAPETPAEKSVETPATGTPDASVKPAETSDVPAVSGEEPVAEASVPETAEEVKEQDVLNTLSSSDSGVVSAVATALSGISTLTATVAPFSSAVEPDFEVPWADYEMSPGEEKDWTINVESTKIAALADVIFVIDTTGSMSSAIAWVQSVLADFATDLESAGATDINWGIFSFGDVEVDSSPINEDTPLGEYTMDELRTELSGLTMTGGGDSPEDLVYATMKAVAETAWREGSQRFVISLTDAGTKERPAETVDGKSVTATGLADLLADYGVDMGLHTVRYDGSNSLSLETGISAITIDDLADALGITHHHADTEDDLKDNLSISLIDDTSKTWEYSYHIDMTYEDGTPSSDIEITINPSPGFSLTGNATGAFDISAVASSMAAAGKKTTAVITFLVNGEPVNGGVGATQTITLMVDEEGHIIIFYVDQDGNLIAAPDYISGPVGSDYNTSPLIIDGYELLTMTPNTSGVYPEGYDVVIYMYNKIKASVPPVVPTYVKPQKPSKPQPIKAEPMKQVRSTVVNAELPATGEEENMMLFIIGMTMLSLVGGFVIWMKLPKGRHSA